jgi:hypothetical protein
MIAITEHGDKDGCRTTVVVNKVASVFNNQLVINDTITIDRNKYNLTKDHIEELHDVLVAAMTDYQAHYDYNSIEEFLEGNLEVTFKKTAKLGHSLSKV